MNNGMCGLLSRAKALIPLLMLVLAACGPTARTTTHNSPSLSSPTSVEAPSSTATPAPAAPACEAKQLAGQFASGGYATGNATGEILLRNISSSACALWGQVDFYGVDAQGKRIAATGMNRPQTLALVVLPPHTPAATPGDAPTAGAYLIIDVIGAYRDDPTASNGLCSAANEVTPSRFVISVGSVSMRVTNYDPAGVSFKSIYGCHGVIIGGDAFVSS